MLLLVFADMFPSRLSNSSLNCWTGRLAISFWIRETDPSDSSVVLLWKGLLLDVLASFGGE